MKQIMDQYTQYAVSRQRKWQLRKKASRCCIYCGKPSLGRNRCPKCARSYNKKNRKKRQEST